MNEAFESIELELEPIPPDTVASVKAELMQLIHRSLQEGEKDNLLSNGQIKIQIEKTFPTDAAIVVGLTFLSGVALETYKVLVLPALQKRFAVKERPKPRQKKHLRK